MKYISEKFSYKHGGSGNIGNGIISAEIPNCNDVSQWTRCNVPAKYGTYEWAGKIIDHITKFGWCLQGIASKDHRKYISFEFSQNDRMRCMVYDKYISHKYFFFIPWTNNRTSEIWLDELRYNNSNNWRFDYLDWLRYKIVWKKGLAEFYINDSLVARLTKHVPKEEDGMFFHIHAAASPSFPAPGRSLITKAKDIKIN